MNLAELIHDPAKAARAVKLVYVNDTTPGFSRHRTGDHFTYKDTQGHQIDDEETLARIRKMALPPAWEHVWICAKPNGHLQATGIDTKGRKQYRYHANWNAIRSETKFFRMIAFGEQLPELRARIEKDLKNRELTKEKVIAIALSVMEQTLIRIGNASYEKEYGHYGLTTLKDKHVNVGASGIQFRFKGKKGIYHDIKVQDRRLARLVKACRDIPGKELFQYYDETGDHRSIDSGMVNEYLRECTGEDFSAKDLRTWAGTVNALRLLAELEPCSTDQEAKKNINTVLEQVAHRLGNTRTVSRKYYVHPQILEAYECQDLTPYLKRKNQFRQTSKYGLDPIEKLLLRFLKDKVEN
ncbi:DNA topoisomerase IB [Larkinella terrae]|uniref:DNA topoisomerase n=1 Tax=Larkinella terrae TaxID=2025311 RepID=A0A7K0EVL7_9BACT|nr:DNA topoisomerase IB [Larkinella terrae]MRS65616.1 DNA topoisomerase IB [Larkinella terrae]